MDFLLFKSSARTKYNGHIQSFIYSYNSPEFKFKLKGTEVLTFYEEKKLKEEVVTFLYNSPVFRVRNRLKRV